MSRRWCATSTGPKCEQGGPSGPRAKDVFGVGLAVAAVTPPVLLAPVSGLIVGTEAFVSFFCTPVSGFDTTRVALAVAAHPTITVSCGLAASAAVLLAGQNALLFGRARAGLCYDATDAEQRREAQRLGTIVGAAGAALTPFLIWHVEPCLHGLAEAVGQHIPASVLFHGWIAQAGFGTFSYLFCAYALGVPLCAIAGRLLGPTIANAVLGGTETKLGEGAWTEKDDDRAVSAAMACFVLAALLLALTADSLRLHGHWRETVERSFVRRDKGRVGIDQAVQRLEKLTVSAAADGGADEGRPATQQRSEALAALKELVAFYDARAPELKDLWASRARLLEVRAEQELEFGISKAEVKRLWRERDPRRCEAMLAGLREEEHAKWDPPKEPHWQEMREAFARLFDDRQHRQPFSLRNLEWHVRALENACENKQAVPIDIVPTLNAFCSRARSNLALFRDMSSWDSRARRKHGFATKATRSILLVTTTVG